jgi:peptide/nickel transport system substrate-binding protein
MNIWDSDVKRHLALGVPLDRVGRGPTMSRRQFGGMVGLVTLVAACGRSENGGSSTGSGGALNTIQVGTESLDAEQWAPHRANGYSTDVQFIIGDTLIRTDPKTRALQPGLATAWNVSPDGKVWTFNLRKGTPFQKNYGEMTAEDVKYTWSLFLRDDAIQSRTDTFRSAIDGNMDNFEIVDPYTFRLHAKDPVVTLPSSLHLGVDTMVIHSKKYHDEVGFDKAFNPPIATGSFMMTDHKDGASVTFEAVKDHWRQTPAYQTLMLKIVPEQAARLAQLRSGDLNLATVPLTLIPEAQSADLGVQTIDDCSIANIYFGGMYFDMPDKDDPNSPWIQRGKPEAGRAVRQAMSYAIDRKSIVDNLLLGQGKQAVGPIVYFEGMPFTDPSWTPDPYDVDKAKQLLAQGGYPNGFDVKVPVYEQSGRPASKDITEAVASWWTDLGLKVERQPMDATPTWDDHVTDRTTAGYVDQWSQSFVDEPADRFADFTIEHGGADFHDEAITKFLPAMSQDLDVNNRMQAARDLGDALRENFTALGLVTTGASYVLNSGVAEWPTIRGTGELRNLEYIKPGS